MVRSLVSSGEMLGGSRHRCRWPSIPFLSPLSLCLCVASHSLLSLSLSIAAPFIKQGFPLSPLAFSLSSPCSRLFFVPLRLYFPAQSLSSCLVLTQSSHFFSYFSKPSLRVMAPGSSGKEHFNDGLPGSSRRVSRTSSILACPARWRASSTTERTESTVEPSVREAHNALLNL